MNFRRQNGFTLVEIVVVLTILALIVGASIPTIDGVVKQHKAGAPIEELAEMARSVRKRAMDMQRPYQIGLDSGGCYASPYFQPYEQAEEFENLQREIEARAIESEILADGAARYGDQDAPEPDPDTAYLERYEWPEGMKVKVRFWGDPEWEDLGPGAFRRWVFQPSGLSKPLTIQLENDGVFLEAEFNPMTAEIQRERAYVD